ncbi:MAG TPA: Mur ligase family protein, partial [Candidatus Sulfotelmatobacter sp.]|nr:Mur ligase family protein [Candidatus Sulfotelmatobacter sp.]
DIALVTNVRPVHLEFFESVDGIAAAKGELFAVLRENATAVVNLDDARVRVQAARHAGPRVTFGQTAGADVVLLSVSDRFLPGAALTLRIGGRTRTLSLRVGGAHAALDALTFMEPAPGRGRISELPGPMTLVDDTYNSNPEALASVLRTLGASSPAGRRVLVMGDMLELGANAAAFHREAGEQIAASGIGLLVTVGPLSRQAAEVARRAGIEVAAFDDASGAAGTIASLVRPGDLVVVKGSRGIRLEQVVDALVTRRGEAA